MSNRQSSLTHVARMTATVAVSCIVLAVILVALGHGPWTRWLAPTLLVTGGSIVVASWMSYRSRKVSPPA